MSVRFNCPECDNLIAFNEQHIGKPARCLNCSLRFYIHEKNYDKPKVIKEAPEKPSDPVEGFYKAALIDNFKTFVDK